MVGVGDEGVDVGVVWDVYEMVVVWIDEEEGMVGWEVMIELWVGVVEGLEGGEWVEVGRG